MSGQQSFIIDRGEQVHTLEAAKALLAAQVAAFPPQIEEAYDDEEPFDIEVESEVETEETEGLTEESAAGEEGGGETDAEGHKRKRRRRRRGRPGEPREGGPARDSTDAPRIAPDQVAAGADEAEGDEDESEEQPGAARADQAAGRRAAAPPSRTSRRTPPARRTGGWSGRIDRGRTRADIGAGSSQRGRRFRRIFCRSGPDGCSARTGRRRRRSRTASRSRSAEPEPARASSEPEIRSGDRRSRRAPAFHRARKGELPDQRPARSASARHAQPA